MMIGTESGATCEVTWEIVNTRPRGAVLMTVRVETWHWWKTQRYDTKAKMSPARTMRIANVIRNVFFTTDSCEARCCAE